jgi:hypothetical protein
MGKVRQHCREGERERERERRVWGLGFENGRIKQNAKTRECNGCASYTHIVVVVVKNVSQIVIWMKRKSNCNMNEK